jgi:hypothetical protein
MALYPQFENFLLKRFFIPAVLLQGQWAKLSGKPSGTSDSFR